jgi:hypothetical protein
MLALFIADKLYASLKQTNEMNLKSLNFSTRLIQCLDTFLSKPPFLYVMKWMLCFSVSNAIIIRNVGSISLTPAISKGIKRELKKQIIFARTRGTCYLCKTFNGGPSALVYENYGKQGFNVCHS